MNRLARRSFLALMVLTAASPASAWGPQGHRVIADVASDRLTPAAREGVRALLHQGDTLADVANWADHDGHTEYPGSAPWHYVNVPIASAHYDGRDCPRGDCVVEKIKHYEKVLADRNAPLRTRQHALLFLVHLIADVHQPLHVGDHGDRGGNLTQIQFLGRGTNLHRLWDSDLIHHIGGPDRSWVERVEETITPEAVAAWSRGTVENWADESLIAAQRAYHHPEGAPGPLVSGAELGEDYVRMAEPILRTQMARAGVRLANALNAILR